MPFRFVDDITTADVAFEAWGDSPEELFIASALALLSTMVDQPELVARQVGLTFVLEHAELDLLLWSFLQELIFYKDARQLLLHADWLHVEKRQEAFRLEAVVSGERIDAARHRLLVDVKAVTLHCFEVVFMDGFWKAVVVLDV